MSDLPPVRNMHRFAVEVHRERQRQIAKWGDQRHPDGTGWNLYGAQAQEWKDRCEEAEHSGTQTWALILLEEVFEACQERDSQRLREELVQVSAVAQAWLAHLYDRGN